MALTPEKDRALSLLMEKGCAGDRISYGQLLGEISRILEGFVFRRLGRGPDGEDVLQEILLSVHAARHTYDSARPFAPWMYAIARFRICDHWRKAARRLEKQDADEQGIELAPAPAEPQADPQHDKLWQTLERLPDRQRQVIDLIKLKGFSIREAAQEMKMSEAALKVAAHRAYGALRRAYEVEEVEVDG
jgi:RNA polymerase sigma-70 factor (ECF subfamily)